MSTVPLLQVNDLVKRFGALAATDHASLHVQPGQIHALIGPNGAGKSTLLRAMLGIREKSAGVITVMTVVLPSSAVSVWG